MAIRIRLGLGALLPCVALAACELEPLQPCDAENGLRPRSVAHVRRRGPLERSERWRGRIELDGDVFVGPGCRLTLEAGTEVLVRSHGDASAFAHASLLDTLWGRSEVNSASRTALFVLGGEIEVQGTPEAAVRMRPHRNRGSDSWSGLVLARPKFASFRGLELRSAYRGLEIEGPLENGELVVRDSVFEDIRSCGLCLGGESPDKSVIVEISGNRFRRCEAAGLEAHSFVSGVIDGNVFASNRGASKAAGLRLAGNSLSLRRNTFSDNDIAIDCAAYATPGFVDNVFHDARDGSGSVLTTCDNLAGLIGYAEPRSN